MKMIEYISHMGTDITVVNAARVSFLKESVALNDKDKSLIRYLAKHKHWTPFAHPQITLRVTAPISIRTQCFKHKQGFVENEMSRRYVTSNPEVFMPKWRMRPEGSIKQGSGGLADEEKQSESDTLYQEATKLSLESYRKLVELGVAPEQARFVLPQGTLTQWYWTGSLAAYARFYSLRSTSDAQSEIQELAEEISDIISPLFPVSWSSLIKSD